MFKKLPVLLTIVLMITSIVLLAIGMPTLNLNQQGKSFSFPRFETEERELLFEPTIDEITLPPFSLPSVLWQRFVGASLAVLLIASILTKEGRRRLWLGVLWLISFSIMVYAYTLVLPQIQAWILSFQQFLKQRSDAPVLQFISTIPPHFILLISLLLAAIVVLAGWAVARAVQRRRIRQTISAEARTALTEIKAGAELRHVIIEAYQAMNDAVDQAHGVARKHNTTPREFEDSLLTIGLPQPAIQTLTRLFEQVRYGAQSIDAAGRSEAQRCLQAIIDACEGVE